MRIAMISKALVVGAYHSKIEALVRRGVEVHVIMPSRWGNQAAEIVRGKGYSIHLLQAVFSGKNHFHGYRHLKETLLHIAPEILHVDEESYSVVTFQALRLARQLSIPAVFFNWQNIHKSFPFPFSAIERHSFRCSAAALAGNAEAKAVILRKGFTKPVFVIPQFGVDPAKFRKKRNTAQRKKLFGSNSLKVVGFGGRFVEEKGILDLINAFVRLGGSTRLLLLGGGTLRNEIENRIGQAGIHDRVSIVHNVPSSEMADYLNCMDCLVLPSRTRPNWKEQFGRILVEAMACEVPVVGSDSGEIPNVIGNAGLVFPEGDVAALGECLRKLLTDKRLHEKLAAMGRKRVLMKFTHEKIAEDTLSVYQHLLKDQA